MTPVRSLTWTDGVFLALIVAAAGGLRGGYLSAWAEQGRTGGPLRVQDQRPEASRGLVENVREHNWYGADAPLAGGEEQTAHAAPGFPWALGLLAKLPWPWEQAARWIQCALGAATAGLYFLFARRAFRSRPVGALAGLLCALHPLWVVNAAELNDGVLGAFLLAAALVLGARASQENSPLSSLLFGLSLAGMALVRAALLPFAFAALVWFLWRSRSLTRGWLAALLAFLGFANGVAPWTARNLQVFRDVFPVTDALYLHLWEGNNPRATGGPLSEAELLDALAERRGVPAADLKRQLADMGQPQRYASLARDVAAEVGRDPAAFLRRRLQAGLYFGLGQEWFASQRLAAEEPEGGATGWPAQSYPAVAAGTLLAMFLLAFLGWRWSYPYRRESMPAALAVIWVPLPYLLSHAERLHGPRLPLDGLLLCFAAYALVGWVGRKDPGERG
jgi:4-amino-4-deoxy-L-arabinose transferase-like glycosyltransferase